MFSALRTFLFLSPAKTGISKHRRFRSGSVHPIAIAWRPAPSSWTSGIRIYLMTLVTLMFLTACKATMPPLETVAQVDIPKFMGDWYVIANIPTFIETEAYNAVENYHLDDDGSIATTFTFRKGGFDGPEKEYNPRGFIVDTETNAEWGMQFVWPFKGDYRVIYLDDDYSVTIVGRNKRDYVWLMARDPQITEQQYQAAVDFIKDAGYSLDELRKVPQQWPDGPQS